MPRQENPSQDSSRKSSAVGELMYPTREQFACVRCKNKKFTSWNDFENHHAKHAVDFTFSQLPVVKLQRIKILPFNSENVRPSHQDSETSSSSAIIINSIETTTTRSSVVSEASNETITPCENKEPSKSKLSEEEEMLTWPGSCESSSPLNSPMPVSTSSETITSSSITTGEPPVDSNILDPAFIEKLGEEISFLNQTLVDSVTNTIANVPKESLSEVQSCDVNTSGTSSSSISISDFPVPSLVDIPLPEPITPETSPAEKATTSNELDKPEDQLPVINEKDVLDRGNESIPPPKEAELPKSKGQLRLVPFESLLSPSFLHADQEEEDGSLPIIQSPISPSKSSNKPQAMVAIPERNLEDLNILPRTSTADSAPVKSFTEAVSAQQVLQKSQQTEIATQNMLQATQVDSLPPQQQRLTPVYQFHNLIGQGNHQLQSYQQPPHQVMQQQHQQNNPQQQQHNHPQQQQQNHPQQQQQNHPQQQQQNHPQQQQQNHSQQQQQNHQQQQPNHSQQQQNNSQQQQQQNHSQQQQQTHFQQQQYVQQQHQGLNPLQFQQQQQPYQQQIIAGQQQNLYVQAPQYMQRFSNQQRMQYPLQSYSASCRAIQPNQLTRAVINSAIALSNSNGTIHVAPLSTNFFQQTINNSVPSMPSSNLIQQQLAGHGSYNHAAGHINNSLSHYPNRPQTSTIQHVQLQIPATQSSRPIVSTTQPTARPQAIAPQSQGIRLAPISASTNSARLQQPVQQRQGCVAIRPHIQPSNSLCPPRGSLSMLSQVTHNSQIVGVILPTTTTSSVTTSSAIRLPASSHQGQTAANAIKRPLNHKRPLVVEGEISKAGQPAYKIPRTEDAAAAVPSNVSTAQKSGDCEVLIVQKKQTGLPVIQSVEGGGNTSASKSSAQALQTPSVASLLSNPNITVTPAKNKENQAGSDAVASKAANTSTNTGVNSVIRTTNPITIDLTSTSSLPQQRNPLQCQVCNETFNSQSLLKNHLVLHLRKVHPTTAGPTNSPPVGRNSGSKQTVNSSISRASNVSGQTTDMVTPSTSGYVTSHSSTNNKHGTPSVTRLTETAICSVNTSHQTKNGVTSGQSRLVNEVNVTPLNTTSSPTQSSSNKEHTSIPTDKAASSNSEFYIPVVDLNRQDVITQLESIGINQFIPASNLTSSSNHNNFAIPIMSAAALRRAGTTGFPSLCGVVNLGSPKPFSSTPK